MAIPEPLQAFYSAFPGHTTFTCQTKVGIFTSYTGELEALYPKLKEFNKLGHNVYFTVNETSPQGRKLEDLESIRAIFADDDTLRKKPKKFPLEPDIIVRTSKHGRKYKHQYYWLTDAERDYETWEKVMQGIIEKYDMDVGAKDLARILRVPNFSNHKYDPSTDCVLVQLEEHNYSWQTILKNFPPLEPSVKTSGTKEPAEEDYNELVLLSSFLSGESITPSMNSLIAHWSYHYSADNVRHKVEQLFEQVEEEVKQEHSKRYILAYDQVDKFIRTIKKKINTQRAEENTDNVQTISDTKIVVPDTIDWDWSVLQSNPIPRELIPKPLLEAAMEVGEWTGVGPDPAILSAVFITSALLSKNVLIHEIENDLTTHCQSGICIVMDTGARKSSIYNQMNKPFFEYEEMIKQNWKEEKYINVSKHKTISAKLQKIRAKFDNQAEFTSNEFTAHIERTAFLERQLDEINMYEPWLRSGDVTEEKLVRKLHQNKGVLAVISDDARQVINNIKGKYVQNRSGDIAGESVYINALTGSDILYERVGNTEDIHIKKPVLNALLFVQPDAALGLRNSEMFVPSGLAARLPMYFYPVSGADIIGNTKRRSIDPDKMKAYYKTLKSICHQRLESPLHIVLSQKAMDTCSKFDKKFAKLLQTEWKGHYDKSNKLITLSLMYATCFAALDDPKFAKAFTSDEEVYQLPIKHLNSGFGFATALFSQSISSHQNLIYESLPRKAESFIGTLTKWYNVDKIWEGFVSCGAFSNGFSPTLREHIPEIIDMLVQKKWLLKTKMTGSKRKLNGGFPDKLVDTGETILHLNREGIKKRQDMNIDDLDKALTHA